MTARDVLAERLATIAEELTNELGEPFTVQAYREEIVVTAGEDTPYLNISQAFADVDEFTVDMAGPGDGPTEHLDDVPYEESDPSWLDDAIDRLMGTITTAFKPWTTA